MGSFKEEVNKKNRKLMIIISGVLSLIVLVGTSGYFIYDSLKSNEDESSQILEKYYDSNKKSTYFNNINSALFPENVKTSLLDVNNILSQTSQDSIFTIECNWIVDEGNENVTFSSSSFQNNIIIRKDVKCIPSFKQDEYNYLKNQMPTFIFDDFVQNFFSNKYLITEGVNIDSSFTYFGTVSSQTNYQAIVKYINDNETLVKEQAERITRKTLEAIHFTSELSLVDNIRWQNRTSSSSFEQGANGIYTRFTNQNDENNYKEIKIIVDTYTDRTRPLDGDNNLEPNLRFDLENAIATISHEYGHHLSLYNNKINADNFLAKMKELYSDATFGNNEDGNKIFGSWEEFEKLYKYANGIDNTLEWSEVLNIFRKLYGAHKVTTTNNGETTVSPPTEFSHALSYWQTGQDSRNPTTQNFEATPNPISSTSQFTNQFFGSSISRNNLDQSIEGAQKINTMLPGTNFKYQVKEKTISTNNGNADYDFELDCNNEYFYFYGRSKDYEAIIYENSSSNVDAKLKETIKYFFSYEELIARIISTLTFQYKGDQSQIRPHKGCGFDITTKTDFFGQVTNEIEFDDNVRLENKIITDHLALKRMGIDVFSKGKELLSFFNIFNAVSSKNKDVQIASYNQITNSTPTTLFSYANNVDYNGNDYSLSEEKKLYYKEYKLVTLINLDDSLKNNLFDIKIQGLLGNEVIKAVPFNYTHSYYFSYKQGKNNTLTTTDFDKKDLFSNYYGLVFHLGGLNLRIYEMTRLVNQSTLQSAIFFIDKNQDNVYNSGDTKLNLQL